MIQWIRKVIPEFIDSLGIREEKDPEIENNSLKKKLTKNSKGKLYKKKLPPCDLSFYSKVLQLPYAISLNDTKEEFRALSFY